MPNKVREGQILNRIYELLQAFEDDSFVLAAFAGVIELASHNLVNGVRNSFPDRIAFLEGQVDGLKATLGGTQKALEDAREIAAFNSEVIAELQAEISALQKEKSEKEPNQ